MRECVWKRNTNRECVGNKEIKKVKWEREMQGEMLMVERKCSWSAFCFLTAKQFSDLEKCWVSIFLLNWVEWGPRFKRSKQEDYSVCLCLSSDAALLCGQEPEMNNNQLNLGRSHVLKYLLDGQSFIVLQRKRTRQKNEWKGRSKSRKGWFKQSDSTSTTNFSRKTNW